MLSWDPLPGPLVHKPTVEPVYRFTHSFKDLRVRYHEEHILVPHLQDKPKTSAKTND